MDRFEAKLLMEIKEHKRILAGLNAAYKEFKTVSFNNKPVNKRLINKVGAIIESSKSKEDALLNISTILKIDKKSASAMYEQVTGEKLSKIELSDDSADENITSDNDNITEVENEDQETIVSEQNELLAESESEQDQPDDVEFTTHKIELQQTQNLFADDSSPVSKVKLPKTTKIKKKHRKQQ